MAIHQYLDRYAEAETGSIPLPPRSYRHVLVIPAYREAPELLDRLKQVLATQHPCLVIVVINRPQGSPAQAQLADAIRASCRRAGGNTIAQYYDIGSDSSLLLVDRYSPGRGIARQQGVGLARKIGCDIACRLHHEGLITTAWIFSSDADVCWPDGYFEAAEKANPAASAVLYPFRHVGEPGSDTSAIELYEFSLHYYVAGLRWAGSPYAYHTLGSTLAINPLHYARVRGFPERSGGEDFYLLNKLAKTGPIVMLPGPELAIRDRPSDRVPFGTGPARQRITALDEPLQQYPLYHPHCFRDLRYGLQCLQQLAASKDPRGCWRGLVDSACIQPRPYIQVLQQLGLDRAIDHALRHSSNAVTFSKHLHTWFDGFRSLKCIHALRDQHYPSLGLRSLLEQDSFLSSLLNPQGQLVSAARPAAIDLPSCNRILRHYIYQAQSTHL